MAKKKRKPLPRIGGKAVAPTTARTARTPEGQEITNQMSATPTQDFMGYGHLGAPEVHTGTHMSGRAGLGSASLQDDALSPRVEIDTSKPLHTPRSELRSRVLGKQIRDATERTIKGHFDADEKLPAQVAKHVLSTANAMKFDPTQPLPDIPTDEVARLINDNPEIALEGMTKLGKVMVVPSAPFEDFHFDPLEIKARVMGDLRKGSVDDASDERAEEFKGNMPAFTAITAETLKTATQIDVQAVYDRWMSTKGNDLYELKMAPPWMNAVMLFNTPAGNVWAMHMVASDITDWDEATMAKMRWDPQPPADHTIEWDRVRWIYSVQAYVGGYGQREDERGLHSPQWVQTVGPLMVWRFAIYEDGEPADIHWTHLVPVVPMHKFNNALGVLTELLNMVNCVNVHVVEADRHMPRPQRRRFERMGVSFSEVHVRPTSKSYRGKGTALADMEMPLHGVRGHYANYGADGRGLLFGKLAGRYWIPPHMRGSAGIGTVEQTYTAE